MDPDKPKPGRWHRWSAVALCVIVLVELAVLGFYGVTNFDHLPTGWLFWGPGGVLGLLALRTGIHGWWFDRARGRARCRKCGYPIVLGTQDPSGPTARPARADDEALKARPACPECGWKARRSKEYFKTRRSKRRVILAVLLLCVGVIGPWYGGQVMLRMEEQTEPLETAIVPTTWWIVTLPMNSGLHDKLVLERLEISDYYSDDDFDQMNATDRWLLRRSARRIMLDKSQQDDRRIWFLYAYADLSDPMDLEAYDPFFDLLVNDSERVSERAAWALSTSEGMSQRVCDAISDWAVTVTYPKIRMWAATCLVCGQDREVVAKYILELLACEDPARCSWGSSLAFDYFTVVIHDYDDKARFHGDIIETMLSHPDDTIRQNGLGTLREVLNEISEFPWDLLPRILPYLEPQESDSKETDAARCHTVLKLIHASISSDDGLHPDFYNLLFSSLDCDDPALRGHAVGYLRLFITNAFVVDTAAYAEIKPRVQDVINAHLDAGEEDEPIRASLVETLEWLDRHDVPQGE